MAVGDSGNVLTAVDTPLYSVCLIGRISTNTGAFFHHDMLKDSLHT